MKHKYYLNTLTKLASANNKIARARVAACIVHKKTIVSFGFNQKKTHPLQAKYCSHGRVIFLHAEISAIKNAMRHLTSEEISECTLYVCRVKVINGEFVWGLAKPCPNCSKAIAELGIKNVVYTNDNNALESL